MGHHAKGVGYKDFKNMVFFLVGLKNVGFMYVYCV